MSASELTPESLNLSASLFTSSIASWIPSNFGHQPPPGEAEKEWQQILSSAGEGKDRLGLGHPLINAPKNRGQTGYGRGMQGLEKSLKRKKGSEDQPEEEKKGEESEEEESRASMVGKKKKVAVFDPLGGKKKKGGGGSGGNSAVTSARASPAVDVTASKDVPAQQMTSAPDPSIESTTPALPSTTSSIPSNESSTQTSEPVLPTQATQSTSTSPIKSKSALKRERKRQAKLMKQAQNADAV